MNFNQFAYFAYLVLAPSMAILLGVLIFFIWPHRRMVGVAWLLGAAGALMGWLLSNTVELLLPTENATLIASHTTYIFIVLFPPTFFVFAVAYVRPRWHRPITKRPWIVYLIPALTLFFVWTNNPLHWKAYAFNTYYGLLALDVLAYGPWFWIQTAYGYLVALTGWGLLVYLYFSRRRTSQRTSKLILSGAVFAIFANLLYILRLLPTTKDYSPFFLSIAIVLIILGVLRERIFNLRPLAGLLVIDNLDDGILLLDDQKHIIDINAATQKILRLPSKDILGQPITDFLPGCSPTQSGEWHEIVLHPDDEPVFCEMQCLPIRQQSNESAGYVVTLRNISARKHYESLLLNKVKQTNRLYDASHALLKDVALDAVLHHIVQNAHTLLDDNIRVVWYPLHAALPQTNLAYPSGETIPPLNAAGHMDTTPLKYPIRIIQRDERTVYIQPVQTSQNILGLLAFEHTLGYEFANDIQKALENYALTAAFALQNAIYHNAIMESAVTDNLTRVYNRRGLFRLARENQFTGTPYGYVTLMIDIDHLDEINAQYGQESGDAVLQKVSALVQKNLRSGDVVSRYGGDEFLAILPDLPKQKASAIAERLRRQVEQAQVTHNGHLIRTTVSIGIVHAAPHENIETAIKIAEQALAEAKANGRNCTYSL